MWESVHRKDRAAAPMWLKCNALAYAQYVRSPAEMVAPIAREDYRQSPIETTTPPSGQTETLPAVDVPMPSAPVASPTLGSARGPRAALIHAMALAGPCSGRLLRSTDLPESWKATVSQTLIIRAFQRLPAEKDAPRHLRAQRRAGVWHTLATGRR